MIQAELKKNEIENLLTNVSSVLAILEKENTMEYRRIISYCKNMKKNILICKEFNYGSRKELLEYLKEDWKQVCNFIEKSPMCILFRISYEERMKINTRLEQNLATINIIIDVDWYRGNVWLDFQTQEKLINQFNNTRKNWDIIVNCMRRDNFYEKSKLENIPDDIWSYAKVCSLASDDDGYINWFQSMAFYHATPIEILKMPDGETILRELMKTLMIE